LPSKPRKLASGAAVPTSIGLASLALEATWLAVLAGADDNPPPKSRATIKNNSDLRRQSLNDSFA
jgi:hypothetical protein